MDDKILLDKGSFMALASESRVKLLKKLDERRMTVTELSKELEMSKPAVLKHLTKLVEAGLVKKVESERKWVYYALTMKGKNILHPERVKIILLLSTSLISLIGAIATLWMVSRMRGTNISYESAVAKNLTSTSSNLIYISLFLFILSVTLIAISIYIWINRKEPLLYSSNRR
ncbi:MAG: winged helix-turn-helix transcriptional regulator [Thermoplasmata archaeon]|nr:MAG: winged helix-turn-helix transcriptional regulator [Thermoplasmata archaeon]